MVVIISEHTCFNTTHNVLVKVKHAHSIMIKQHSWIIDTGAINHITCSLEFFSYAKLGHNFLIELPNNANAIVSHIGTVKFTSSLALQNVLCVPTFKFNLMSVSKLTSSKKNFLLFIDSCCVIQDLIS